MEYTYRRGIITRAVPDIDFIPCPNSR